MMSDLVPPREHEALRGIEPLTVGRYAAALATWQLEVPQKSKTKNRVAWLLGRLPGQAFGLGGRATRVRVGNHVIVATLNMRSLLVAKRHYQTTEWAELAWRYKPGRSRKVPHYIPSGTEPERLGTRDIQSILGITALLYARPSHQPSPVVSIRLAHAAHEDSADTDDVATKLSSIASNYGVVAAASVLNAYGARAGFESITAFAARTGNIAMPAHDHDHHHEHADDHED